MEVLLMRASNQTPSEIISTEEYLCKRKEIRIREKQREEKKQSRIAEKRPTLMMAELYM